ncbi:hypothetical protein L914_06165 [Plasmopara halstedii]|uniref:FOG: Ankyrin repeat n=1 Tax=Plasmopara halstedii TaxID=4781 RepID=A0A0P1AJU0_PLAHL|nr:hypothetical protein L914_06165 [Plasmopara halstedii]CEG41511.1 hypothetical protein L914_06165 [Plasmopara halstedii]|eukprot:XP_024577880.1 hypothetical protein L914_06165 [Plasmopara halstedii]
MKKLQQIINKDREGARHVLLDWPHPVNGTTALMVAAMKKNGADPVRALIDVGADLEATDEGKRRSTALHYAAYHNRVAQLELLLNAGANVFALNGKGHTALDVARLRGRKEAAAALTSRLQVHCDWLYIRSKSMLGFWKRRWCVLLACNSKLTSTELCIFRGPHKAHPKAVIWQDTKAETTTYCSRISNTKANAFKLDTGIIYQNLGGRRYSRYRSSGRTHVHKSNFQPSEFFFACDSEEARDAWINALEGQLCGGDSTNTALSSTFMGSPQIENECYRTTEGALPSGDPLVAEPIGRSTLFSHSNAADISMNQEPIRPTAPTFIEENESYTWYDLFGLPALAEQEGLEFPVATVITISGDPDEPQPVLEDRCIVCMDNNRDSVCIPCGHVAGCLDCMRAVTQENLSCPICRAHVDGVVRI